LEAPDGLLLYKILEEVEQWTKRNGQDVIIKRDKRKEMLWFR
jgi:hypothetical protein